MTRAVRPAPGAVRPGVGDPLEERVAALAALLLGDHPETLPDLAHWTARDWHRLALLAIRHRAAPLLSDRLDLLGPATLAFETHQRLREHRLQAGAKTAAIRHDLAEALDALSRAGIDVMPLKGAALADLVYEVPAHRPLKDLDLLVRPECAEAASRILVELGYEPIRSNPDFDYAHHHHLRPLERLGSLPIEIHVGLGSPGDPFPIDYEGLWARAVPTIVVGREVPTMSPEDMVLHLCTHFTHAFDVPILGVYDIVALSRTFRVDWEVVAAEGLRDGRAPFAAVGLGLVRRLFGVSPAGAEVALPETPEVDHIADCAVDYLISGEGDAPDWVRTVGDRSPGMAGWRSLLEAAAPPPDAMRRIYRLPEGSPLVFLLYLWRPLDLLRRRGVESLTWIGDRRRRRREARRRELVHWSRSVSEG